MKSVFSCHFRSLEIITPRSFICSTTSSLTPAMLSSGTKAFDLLVLKSMTLHFIINLHLNRSCKFYISVSCDCTWLLLGGRTCFRECQVINILQMDFYGFSHTMFFVNFSSKFLSSSSNPASLISMRNRNIPNTVPCGPPPGICSSQIVPNYHTINSLSIRNPITV